MSGKLESKTIHSRADVIRHLRESSPGWLYEACAENTWDATAILLFSAAVLGTTDPNVLARFTGYNMGFVCAVAWNMRNNGLWTSMRYIPKGWSPETGADDDSPFWEEVKVGYGWLWYEDAESEQSVEIDVMDFQKRERRGVKGRGTSRTVN